MNKRLTKIAQEWIEPHLNEAIYDCSDSAEEAEALASRFLERADDKTNVEAYVKLYLKEEYLDAVDRVLAENGDSDNDLSQTAMDLLFYP